MLAPWEALTRSLPTRPLVCTRQLLRYNALPEGPLEKEENA